MFLTCFPSFCSRMFFSSVVFPAPRNPDSRVTGTGFHLVVAVVEPDPEAPGSPDPPLVEAAAAPFSDAGGDMLLLETSDNYSLQ